MRIVFEQWGGNVARPGANPVGSTFSQPRTPPRAVGSSRSPSAPRRPSRPSTEPLCPDFPMVPLGEMQVLHSGPQALTAWPPVVPRSSPLPHSVLPHWPSGYSRHMPTSCPRTCALPQPSAWCQVHWAWVPGASSSLAPRLPRHFSQPPHFKWQLFSVPSTLLSSPPRHFQ